MTKTYACMNYGSCASAGTQQAGPAGVAQACPDCGNLMSAQSRSQTGGFAQPLKWATFGLGALLVILFAWKSLAWMTAQAGGRDLTGRWRAEETTIFAVALPVGLNLEFGPDSAIVLDTRIPVAEYARDGDRVRVILTGGSVDMTFVFRFEDSDHMVYEGPFGVTLKYHRIRGSQ